jgi:AcrR family transcriptional regulator
VSRDIEILDAATELFFQRGYAGVGVDDIGELTGTTGPSIYRHFRGKGEILAALFDQAIDGVLSATGSNELAPHAELAHRVRAHARFVVDHHKLASVWIREGRHLADPDRRRLRRRENAYISQWTGCIRGVFAHMDKTAAETAALTAIGTLNSVSNWPVGATEGPRVAEYLADFVLRGLGLAPNGSQPDVS